MKRQLRSFCLKVCRVGKLIIPFFMLGLLLIPAPWSFAGMIVQERLELIGMSPLTGEEMDSYPPRKITNYYQGKKVRTETEKSTYILDFDKGMMISLNSSTKSYKEFSLAKFKDFQKKAKQLSGQLRKRLESQLETLPPAQREEMRKKLDALSSNAVSSAQDTKVTVKATGKEKKINGYPCQEYEMFRDEKKVAQYWLTRSVSGKAMDVYQKEIKKWVKGMGPVSDLYYKEWQHISGKGFPIKINNVSTKIGKLSFNREVLHIEEKILPESYFLPPQEYKRTEVPASPLFGSSLKKQPEVSKPSGEQAAK